MRGSPLSFGLVAGRPLFMDAEEDNYFLLAPPAERMFVRWLDQGAPAGRVPPELEQALGGRLPPRRPAESRRPTASILSNPPGRPSPMEILEAWKRVRAARRAIRRMPFSAVLARMETGGASGRVRSPQQPGAAALRFAAALRMAPAGGNCLSRSVALAGWLAARQCGAALIFGAKLDPFAAHCWVQSGELLLNDFPDRVERFTPVRAVQCKPATS